MLRQAKTSKAEEAEVRVGWRMAALGAEVASEVVAGALIGWAVDWWRGKPAGTGVLIGSIAGIIVGLFSLIRGALKLNRQLEKSAPITGRGRPIPFDDPADSENDDDDWNSDQP